jgi:hypothetical protein
MSVQQAEIGLCPEKCRESGVDTVSKGDIIATVMVFQAPNKGV